MKKFLSLTLALVMTFSLAACAPKAQTSTAPVPETKEGAKEEVAKADYKIGVITGTVSQGEEEFRAAEKMKAKYGDMIVTATYPDNFTQETETLISNVLSLADNGAKAIVITQAVPGTSAAIDKVREKYPDMLFIAGVPGEDPGVIASKADVVFQADELGMGVTIIEQAKLMGAKTFIHYSFPRHMSYALLAARRDLLKATCEKEGITFVDATAPDPTGDAGVSGAQQFIIEDIPRMVEKYGKETAFFSTNCSMQEPLIKTVLDQGALFPQQCCPSPYHGYPAALGIEIPEDKKGDVPYAIEQIKSKVAEKDGTGHFSTWELPINMLFVEAGVEYAKAYLDGTITEKNDKAKIEELMGVTPDSGTAVRTYDEADGKYDNFYMILSEYVMF